MQEKPDLESKQFPMLEDLIHSYFHQDFSLLGDTPEEIIRVYKESTRPPEREQTRHDIARFVQEFGATDTALAQAFERVFSPGITVEGWNGMTTRQWLLRIAELLA